MSNEKQPVRPVHEVKLGLVRTSIWANNTVEYGTRYNVKLERLYQVKVGEDGRSWKSTGSLGRDDLLAAAKCLDLAHSWIIQAEADSKKEKAEEDAAG